MMWVRFPSSLLKIIKRRTKTCIKLEIRLRLEKIWKLTKKYNELFFVKDMEEYKGKIATITRLSPINHSYDDVIQLCNAIEHNRWTNLDIMTQFENGVIKIDENRV